MNKNPKISIIIRTKNEERWISPCLNSVINQGAFSDGFEIIIVDNESADRTVDKIKQIKRQSGFDKIKIITCRDYLPGKALNMGIREAKGGLIACLSGHCIPTNGQWLKNLAKNFDNPATRIAGVYGRQEPMPFTPDSDKRDLALVFGLEEKKQFKDSFFHNANSMFRRDTWEETPFSETVTNIEDRVWAQEVLNKNYWIKYEPLASVYHYHGIHQNGNKERCANVVRILEDLHQPWEYQSMDMRKHNIVAFIPVRGQDLKHKNLLDYAVRRALDSEYVKKVIVSTDDENVARLAKEMGALAPFIRDKSLSAPHVDLGRVYKYSLEKIEELGIFPDIIVCLEITFPFRPNGLIDSMIRELSQKGRDIIVAAKKENKAIWKERGKNNMVQLDEGLTPRQFKEPTDIELRGLCCVTYPEFVREGKLPDENKGIYEVDNPCSNIEVRTEDHIRMFSPLMEDWFKNRD